MLATAILFVGPATTLAQQGRPEPAQPPTVEPVPAAEEPASSPEENLTDDGDMPPSDAAPSDEAEPATNDDITQGLSIIHI